MKKLLLASVFAAIAANVHAADFGGVYVGGDIGYSKADDTKGFDGGINAGYGVEMGKWYIGGELGGGISTADGDDLEKKYYYTGAARLGYKATDKVLTYGVLGLEGAEFDKGASSERDWGYRYGIGVETFVRDNVTVRGQVDYIDWQGENGLSGDGELRTSLGVAYHF
ncbi:outer membrane beta-barrel protein [Sinorhizobium meliloti]|nr:outer membrane beta-barrel protein [Sinorhizobium meliloti]